MCSGILGCHVSEGGVLFLEISLWLNPTSYDCIGPFLGEGLESIRYKTMNCIDALTNILVN